MKNDKLKVELLPYESRVFIVDEDLCYNKVAHSEEYLLEGEELDIIFDVSIAFEKPYDHFVPYKKMRPKNITHFTELPDFSGVIKYEAIVNLSNKVRYLDFGRVGETARLTINHKYVGTKICNPYGFDVKDFIKNGENHISIEVANTLVFREKDMLSTKLTIMPSGLLGPIKIYWRP